MSLNTKVRTFCMLQPLWILLALPVLAGTARIYVTNFFSPGTTNSISVIDTMNKYGDLSGRESSMHKYRPV